MAQWKIGPFLGLDQSKDAFVLDGAYSPALQNVSVSRGVLRRAKGCEKVTETPLSGGILSLMAYHGANGTEFLAANTQGVYALKEGSWVCLRQQATDGFYSCLNYAHNGLPVALLGCAGQGLSYDGETAADAVFPQGAKYLTLHYERVWAGGIQAEPDTLYWSSPYDPTNWAHDLASPASGGGFVLLPTWNGGRIRGVRTLFDDVVVFKDEDVLRIYGTYPGNYETAHVSGIVGPLQERTIVNAGNCVFFLSREGLCVYDGLSAVLWQKKRFCQVWETVNLSAASSCACAAVLKDVLYLALPVEGSTENNLVVEIHLSDNTVLLRRGMQVNCFLAEQGVLYYGAQDGFLYRYDEGESYAGAPIESRLWTAGLQMGRPDLRRHSIALYALGRGRVHVRMHSEEGEVEDVFDFGNRLCTKKTSLPLCGHVLQLELFNQNGEDFSLHGPLLLVMEDV